jgi:ABC-type nitrate/sulfonate/bicarbonate transport system substrate-binding protein
MRIGWVMATRRAVRFLGALIIAVGLGWPVIAQAQGKVRIAQQFGLSYLPLHVALELKLIEKHAKALGEEHTVVEVVQLASGAAVNDAMISGSIDVAMAGLTVLLNLRDKTIGKNVVKGMMAIADSPIYFNSIDPRIRSVKDFQETDRIAMTAGKGTQHAVILQMAAAAAFGWDNRAKLDTLAVGISHPDGVAGLLSGGGAFKTHATTVPFIQMELADARVHTVFTSYDVIGSRHTLIVAYAPEHWWKGSPRLYQATFAALSEAMEIIHREPRTAAELFLRRERSKLSLEAILAVIRDEQMLYSTPAPTGVMAFADYMNRTGQLKNKLTSWKDAFFDNAHGLPGN